MVLPLPLPLAQTVAAVPEKGPFFFFVLFSPSFNTTAAFIATALTACTVLARAHTLTHSHSQLLALPPWHGLTTKSLLPELDDRDVVLISVPPSLPRASVAVVAAASSEGIVEAMMTVLRVLSGARPLPTLVLFCDVHMCSFMMMNLSALFMQSRTSLFSPAPNARALVVCIYQAKRELSNKFSYLSGSSRPLGDVEQEDIAERGRMQRAYA